MSQKIKKISKAEFLLDKADSLANISWLWLIFPIIGPIVGNMSLSRLKEMKLEDYAETELEKSEKIEQKARLSIILSITYMICIVVVWMYFSTQMSINTPSTDLYN